MNPALMQPPPPRPFGTTLETFDTVSEWAPSAGTAVADITNVRTGSAALKVTNTTPGTAAYATKNVSMDMSGVDVVQLAFYLTSPLPTGITVYFGQGGFTNYFSKTFALPSAAGALYPFGVGWNHMSVPKTTFTASGSPNWALPIDRLRVRDEVAAGATATVTFDELRGGPARPGGVAFMWDDGLLSAYTEGWAYLKAQRLPGTLYVCTDLLGDAGRVSDAQAVTAASEGCVIASHAHTHTNLTTLSQAAAQTEMATARAYLAALGINTGGHIAYPYGAIDATVLAAWKAEGMLTGRGGGHPSYQPWSNPPASITYRSIGSPTTLATAQGYVDDAIANGYILCCVFHDLVASPDADTEWAISDFQALVDYVVAQQVRCWDIVGLYRDYLSWRR